MARADPDYIDELLLMLRARNDQRAFEDRTGGRVLPFPGAA